jgi:hypothetical protein
MHNKRKKLSWHSFLMVAKSLALVGLSVVFIGCGSNGIPGKWKGTIVLKTPQVMPILAEFDLRNDGTFTHYGTLLGKKVGTGKWEAKGTDLVLHYDAPLVNHQGFVLTPTTKNPDATEVKIPYSLASGNLTLTINKEEILFEHQEKLSMEQ